MNNSVEAGKAAAITSYILVVGAFIAMSMNYEHKNPFASFHIRQSLGISATFITLGLVISNFQNPWIPVSMWIFVSILWLYGMFSAVAGRVKPIPLLGNLFQKVFKTIS